MRFDVPVSERSEEVDLSPSILYGKLDAFGLEEIGSLFGSETVRRKKVLAFKTPGGR